MDLAKQETEKADQFRKRTILMWKANKEVYESHASDLGLAHFWDDCYQDISESIADMEKSDTYAGEPEILALVHVIKRPFAVHYPGTDKSTLFGETYQSLLTRFIFSATQTGEEILQDIMIFCSLRVKRTSPQSCRKLAATLSLERVKQFGILV